MAKSKVEKEVFDRLRAGGLRKSVARALAQASGDGKKLPKAAQKAIADVRAVAAELERRFPGGSTPQQVGGRKAAATRKKNAAKRSSAARKGAQTRARRTAGTGSARASSRSSGTRSSSSRSSGSGRSSSSRSSSARSSSSRARRTSSSGGGGARSGS